MAVTGATLYASSKAGVAMTSARARCWSMPYSLTGYSVVWTVEPMRPANGGMQGSGGSCSGEES